MIRGNINPTQSFLAALGGGFLFGLFIGWYAAKSHLFDDEIDGDDEDEEELDSSNAAIIRRYES